jgi:tetratricopeptide (TPR) repeat protein
MLDDHSSLARLSDYGGVRNWETFKAWVFGGTAGPTGRPLSLLTFLIDGTNWPTDPAPFKRTNLVIHLLNGALVGLFISMLMRAMQYERSAGRWIALVATAIWLMHPFLVSTTLYAVQRMAQLSTLFMMLGIVTWLRGRLLLPESPRRAYLWMSVSIPIFTFLAMIAKENGILLPVLIGTIELTIFSASSAVYGRLDKRWTAVFIWLPFLVIFAYLAEKFTRPTFFEVMPPRDFSSYERLLTQPRIIFDYLQNWFIPKLYTTGVFQDHVIKSSSLMTPVTTLVSIVSVVSIIAFAFWSRLKWPLLSLAILFYFASHLLESTHLNLELYFEHRNYPAVCLLFVPLVALLWNRTSRMTFACVSLGVLLLLGGFTRYSATVWQTEEGIVEASALKAPTSPRAQVQYALLFLNAGRYDDGMRVLNEAIENIPGDNPYLLINRTIALCNLDSLEITEYERVADIVSAKIYDARMLRAYNDFAKRVVEQRCPSISLRSVLPMFTRMLDVPQNSRPSSIEFVHLKFLIGYVHLYLGETDLAMGAFEESLAARPGASYAMAMAALLASSRLYDEALYLSDVALTQLDSENNATLVGQRANESDIREFQKTIRAEMSKLQ